MRVAIVMPEIGFDEVPMMPTMRDETVTKKKPKTTTRRPISERAGEGPCGKLRQNRDEDREDDRADDDDADAQIVARCASSLARRAARAERFTDSRNAETIVGSVLMSVMTPAQATAPAPM